MRISLSAIYFGPRQRKDYGREELEELCKDLREHGQIQPIAVRPPNDEDKAQADYAGQEWVLLAGGRRYSAAALLGWEEIEAFQREDMAPLLAKILELHENLKRKALNSVEEVEAKAAIAELRREENPNIKDWEIAKEIGDDFTTFGRDIETAAYLKKYPNLREAGTKKAVRRIGKLLDENAAQQKRAEVAKATALPSNVLPLEERVVTASAADWLAQLPENSIDLALIDGPYGYNFWKLGQKTKHSKHVSSYDDSPEEAAILYKTIVPELVRVCRESGWLVSFCGKETYDLLEDLLSSFCVTHGQYREIDESRCGDATASGCRFLRPNAFPWIWHRPNSRNHPRFGHLHVQNVVELILVCNLGKGRLVQQGLTNLLTYDTDYGSDRIHANQKPQDLYRDLISRFTFIGDSVLDCFYGSGNSLAAAASLGRIPWGCDKNPQMLSHALGRIRASQTIITEEAIEESHERYRQALAGGYVEEEAEELEAVSPEPKQRSADGDWTWEVIGRVDESYLGCVYYDSYNLGQLRDDDQDKLEMRLADACQSLAATAGLGILDPVTCTPEDVMQVLKEAEL